ncbi:hypothetical protein [Absidia glauca]|uniref:Uncharacterized protein n=1 Tax=Absidia glauca TaxID=4829 RepID=A0A163K7P9_ABSGL|nr:hypothetical protein [Absidia glauca]
MQNKSSFLPKDARIMSYYDDDEMDTELGELGDLNPSGATTRRKKTTGTQALAEFLSTTSPEEFQSNKSKGSSSPIAQRPTSAEPSSISFFKLRKSKRALNRLSNNNLLNPSKAIFSSMQNTQQSSNINYGRKNYIEITPKTSSSAATAAAATVTSSPVLPQMGHHKKRDSSLYSGSLRHSSSIRSQLTAFSATAATTTANGRMVGRHLTRQDPMETGYVTPNLWNQHQMTLAGGNSNKRRNDIKGTADDQQQRKGLTQALLSTTTNMDVIEAGLIQRLERSKLAGFEKPSDQVAQTMGNEHVRALDVSFQQESTTTTTMTDTTTTTTKTTKPRVRHAQVQTMDIGPEKDTLPRSSLSSLSILSSPIISGSQFPSPVSDTATNMTSQGTQDTATIEQLKQQLDEEKKHRQRLQASLDDTKDHFEVLSGLAYKKLREIWEEKLRWENTCIDLNQQLMMMAQPPESHLHPATDDLEDINSVLDNVSVLS